MSHDPIDPKQLVLDLGKTFANLGDGTVDEGDLVVLKSLNEIAEHAATGKLEDFLDDEKIRVAFQSAGAIIPILVSMLWPD